MKALKYILFLTLILIIGFTIYIAVQPNSFEIKRDRTINAPTEVIYNNVIDFKNWEAWSPWVEKDPETVITLSDQTKDVGGSFSWVDSHGIGTMKTLESNKPQSIRQELQFGEFEPSQIQWTFEPTEDGKTNVTWKMSSENVPFMFKASAFFSGGFDNMIGPDFESGLAKLDKIVVASTKVYAINVDGITQHGGGFYLYNSTSAKMDNFEIVIQELLSKISNYVQENNITTAGPPFVSYHKWDEKNNTVMFSCSVPTTAQVISTQDDILTGQLEPFTAVKTTLNGNYKHLKEAWEKTIQYTTKNELRFTEQGLMLEVYVTDPAKTPNPSNLITEIYIQVEETEQSPL
ncbi:transcription activator effector-binding protein [Flavobacteriaceae bacterium LYZ1037]|nr:transcription activator effector-binding protein [Flavobacteriaceae bacterium LYZ1037]